MIFFLYGEDDFSSSEKLNKIKQDFLNQNAQGAVLSVLDFGEKTEGNFEDSVGAGGLFSSSKLIIVKNILFSADKTRNEKVFEYLKNNEYLFSDKETIIVFWEKKVSKKTTKLFKLLNKEAKTFQFELLEGKKLEDWIKKKVDLAGGKISSGVVGLLAANVGGNLWKMNNEIEKLICMKDGEEIELNDVEMSVEARTNSDIFKTIEALSMNDKSMALKLLHNQIKNGDDPFYIFSMYVYQFRNLLKIGGFYFSGLKNHFEIAKAAKLHPFVVQKGIAQLNRFSLNQLKEIYQKLEDIDTKAKTGEIDILLALDKFVVEL